VEEDLSGPKKFLDKIFKRKEKDKKKEESPKKAQPVSKGDKVLVQVVKEPFGTKGARLTTHISLAGRFVVFMPYDKHLGISKRIDNHEERQRLKDILKELDFAQNAGFIVRTVASEQGKRDLIREAKFLFNMWQKIKKQADEKSAPALVYKEYDLLWRVVRDFITEDVSHILIDSQEECNRIQKFVATMVGREMVGKISVYKGSTSLFESKNVLPELDKIFEPRVYLKSGAYVVIEPTEGLTVVDVNSGKFKAHASPEDAAFMVNMEAAPEIARQLRLRDVGGIIVIDFIDMMKEGHKRQVLDTLQRALESDRAKTEVNRISSLGLVEMTRERTAKTIESLSSVVCPYCQGRGRVRIN